MENSEDQNRGEGTAASVGLRHQGDGLAFSRGSMTELEEACNSLAAESLFGGLTFWTCLTMAQHFGGKTLGLHASSKILARIPVGSAYGLIAVYVSSIVTMEMTQLASGWINSATTWNHFGAIRQKVNEYALQVLTLERLIVQWTSRKCDQARRFLNIPNFRMRRGDAKASEADRNGLSHCFVGWVGVLCFWMLSGGQMSGFRVLLPSHYSYPGSFAKMYVS